MSLSARYGSNASNTSKYLSDLLNEYNKMPRGVFNENRRNIQDITLFGIHPIECWEMLPNSDAYITYDIQMISKNPTIRRLLSSMDVELRCYKIDYNDTWEGWNNFITKGRSGRVSKSIPHLNWSLNANNYSTCLPYNPAFSLGLAPAAFVGKDTANPDGIIPKFSVKYNSGVQPFSNLQNSKLTGINNVSELNQSEGMKISALPFVFYNKIVKLFNQSNLLQSNPHWYPENEEHDNILPYSIPGDNSVTTSDFDNPQKSFIPGTSILEMTASDESYPWLNVLHYAMRKGDMFNTGSPFPDLIRGDIPTIATVTSQINWDNVIQSSTITSDANISNIVLNNSNLRLGLQLQPGPSTNLSLSGYDLLPGSISPGSSDQLKAALSKATVEGINFSMRSWRYLATLTVMKERLALTDGTYNEMIKAMFGHNPNWHSHEPMYCGGSKQPIIFSEVVNQTSGASAPLGDTAGRAVSSKIHNQIHVHSDDFGMFMTVLVVRSDEYMCQGVDKMFSRLENSQQYFPIMNNLSPDAILNKELFVSGVNDNDEDVFNYQEREYFRKSRRNKVAGLMALPASLVGDVGVYLQNRLFGSTPQFNAEFTRGNLTDNEKAIFASPNQAEFCAVIGSNFTFVGPVPEDSRPSDMGISY